MGKWAEAEIVQAPTAASKPPAWQSAPAVEAAPAQPQREIVATTQDGGEIYRMENGTLAFTSPGYSTTDPETVDRLMQGAQPVDIVQDSFDNQRIEANEGLARTNELARGVPFVGSYVDEAIGAVNPQRGQELRDLSGAMQRQRPGETMGLNIGGAVAGSIPMAAAAAPSLIANAGRTVGARAMQGAALGLGVGATEGAIYGSGEGQGAERGQNALTGAGIGAVAGGALGAAAPYVAQGVQALVGRLRGSDVATVSSALGISRPAATIVRDAIQSGDMQAAEAALQRAGAGAMLADAGPAARNLLDTAATSGGNGAAIARGAVTERTQAATAQMTRALDDTLGAPRGEREIIDAIRTGSQPQRSAAYDAAYAAPIDYASSRGQALEALLRRVPAAAVRRGEEIMRARGEESAQIMARIGDDGRVTFERMPDVRQLHYIMQGLDDIASTTDGQGVMGRQTALGSSYESLRGNISRNLKELVPEFGAAQDIAADTIQEIRATELGYNMLRSQTRREDVARAFDGASDAERAAARQGVRAYIDETTANVARTITDPDTTTREGIRILRDMSSRANQTKMRFLLGTRQADQLLEEIDTAATAFELRAAIAENSKTAMRQSIQGGVDAQSSQGLVRTLAAGEPVNAAKRFVQALTGETAEAQELRRMGLYEEIATALTETRGARAQTALRMINGAIAGQNLSTTQARLITTALTSGGVLAGSRGTSLALQ